MPLEFKRNTPKQYKHRRITRFENLQPPSIGVESHEFWLDTMFLPISYKIQQ